MYSKAYGDWLQTSMDAWSLGVEASAVMAMRMAKLAAGGGAAAREAELMVAEKVRAAAELHTQLAMASLTLTPFSGARKTIKHYRGKVAANQRRLSRRK